MFKYSRRKVAHSFFDQAEHEAEQKKFLAFKENFEKANKIPVTNLLETILLNIFHPKQGILYPEVLKIIKSIYGELVSNEDLMAFYRELDDGDNGCVYFSETKEFFDKHKSPNSSLKFYIINLAKSLQSEEVPTIDFFSQHEIPLKELSDDEINIIRKKIFKIKNEDLHGLLTFIIKEPNENLQTIHFINAINDYRTDNPISNPSMLELEAQTSHKKSKKLTE